jgi:hypothetical protein
MTRVSDLAVLHLVNTDRTLIAVSLAARRAEKAVPTVAAPSPSAITLHDASL